MTPNLIPFKAEHLLMFVHRDGDYIESVKTAVDKEKCGPAFTAMLDGKILGCAGIQIMWPGFGTAWAVFSKDLLEWPIWTTRVVRQVLLDTIRTFKLHRVEMVVLVNSKNARWASSLGFTRERGVARRYTAHGDDVIRYEMVQNG
jgi:hypothetical protein